MSQTHRESIKYGWALLIVLHENLTRPGMNSSEIANFFSDIVTWFSEHGTFASLHEALVQHDDPLVTGVAWFTQHAGQKVFDAMISKSDTDDISSVFSMFAYYSMTDGLEKVWQNPKARAAIDLDKVVQAAASSTSDKSLVWMFGSHKVVFDSDKASTKKTLRISSSAFELAVENATEYSTLYHVQMLLANINVYDQQYVITDTLVIASENNRATIIKYLLDTYEFDTYVLASALARATPFYNATRIMLLHFEDNPVLDDVLRNISTLHVSSIVRNILLPRKLDILQLFPRSFFQQPWFVRIIPRNLDAEFFSKALRYVYQDDPHGLRQFREELDNLPGRDKLLVLVDAELHSPIGY